MAGIKDLFKSIALISKSLNDVDPGVESPNFANASLTLQKEAQPRVDFSDPSNFVFYGQAEQYYRDAFTYIENEFPYDGSGKEKIDWELQASAFDLYIYNTQYPRTYGYVTIGKDATWTTTNSTGYFTPSRTEYIYFEGGPHPAPQVQAGDKISKFFPSRQNAVPSANYYNETINQQSNLEIDGDRGISLEFWINKDSYVSGSESHRQVICDLWNSASWGTNDYGRFRVEISGSSTADQLLPNFHVELLSGTAGYSSGQVSDSSPTLIMSASSLTGSWNHFALTFQNSGNQMAASLYQNGKPVYNLLTGSSIELMRGSMLGQIGSLVTQVSGAQAQRGYGLLSASLDEFRFWKIKRTAQQIGMNWFDQINGGTNTDFTYDNNAPTKYSYTNPVDLGMYYKFNEGITQINSTDSTVLDYSGRITNGSWTGYGTVTNQRSYGSAIVDAGASAFEFKDPILYSQHPDVLSKLDALVLKGVEYDGENNASIFQSIPGWIRDEDVVNGGNILLKLTQIISSYFDRLQLQIKELPTLRDINYVSSSMQPLPFVNRLVDSTGLTMVDLFSEASALEELAARDDFRLYTEKLSDVKNKIYKNIYNNLSHILKSKGTEKSFRNLIRCYGIGEELVKLNLYGDEVSYIIEENFESTITRKKYANFFETGSFVASVYQSASAADTGAQSYLSASTDGAFGHTFEAEIFFPKRQKEGATNDFYVPFSASSLFGLHTVNPSDPESLTWHTPDVANFQVRTVRSGLDDKDAFFMLTGTAGAVVPTLTSSLIKDVYDNSKWNLAVRLKPSTSPWATIVTGSATATTPYDVEFVGYNTTLDIIDNSFNVSGTMTYLEGRSFMTSSKRAFVGAHRTNFADATIEQSDVRISSVRFWRDYLDDKTLLAHAKDPSNFGRYHPGQNAFLNQLPLVYGPVFGNATNIPQIETLALQWNFDQVTGSDASGEFIVKDYSSGSLADTTNYGWMGPETEIRHPGKGIDFPANHIDVAIREYIYTAKQQPPEVLNSSNMIEIKNEGDLEIYTKESRPIRYFFAAEKSMYRIISAEMIKLFATVLDFNNLIGEPVNRYRQDYKALEKMRELFFRRVQNSTIDFEKFFDYYKWIDDSITVMLTQLFPISANFSNKIFNMIESHVLERNKYWSKFPTLEMKASDPEAGLYGINEMLYPYRRGGAPIPNSLTGSDCVWWHDRTERSNPNITSGDSTVDTQRDTIREANDYRPSASPPTLTDIASGTPTQYEGGTFALRNFTQPYRFAMEELPVIHGGSNFPKAKKIEYTQDALSPWTSAYLCISASSVAYEKDCNDVIDPNSKNRLEYKLKNSTDVDGYTSGKGTLLAPFSMFSSSVTTGYISSIAANFRTKTDITNYHDDTYGDDKGIPMQSPFTQHHVGGTQHRHQPVVTSSTETSVTRAEAWNLQVAGLGSEPAIALTSRTPEQPRATRIRDEYAKRPLNIRNIKWGTGSQTAGNYRFDYQVLQTSGRTLNNRFFVKNGGFIPEYSASAYVSGVIDFKLPDYSKFGSTKSVFVERFNAPGGPDVSSRGALDIYAEEYAINNDLNYRNMGVRGPLNKWYTDHCGQFGIDYALNHASSQAGLIYAPGEPDGWRQPRWQDYDTLASYHKVNRNAGSPYKVKNNYDREVRWMTLQKVVVENYGTVIRKTAAVAAWDASAQSNQKLPKNGYLSFRITSNLSGDGFMVGLSTSPGVGLNTYKKMEYAIHANISGPTIFIWELGVLRFTYTPYAVPADAYGDRYRILRERKGVFYQRSVNGGTTWMTFFSSDIPSTTDLYPSVNIELQNSQVEDAKISNPQYDNWFVQHAIPQDDLQYAWINDSYDKTKDQPFGHAGSPDGGRTNFTVPSGTTSVTASAIQFVTGACWEPWVINFACYSEVNFAQYDFGVQAAAANPSIYKYTITSSNNTLVPGSAFLNTKAAGATIQGHFNNLNGPYGYPSWKQIRTGETPVARYQRRNNIITVGPTRGTINKKHLQREIMLGNLDRGQYTVSAPYSVMSTFTEPMITFKYRPLMTGVKSNAEISWIDGTDLKMDGTLRHTFCNNLYYFANTGSALLGGFGVPLSYAPSPASAPTEKRPLQIHDALLQQYSNPADDKFKNITYAEGIFPREVNTGLNKTRSRVNYAEDAPVSGIYAVGDYGSNGIDRDSSERRSFWSNAWF